MFMTIFEPFFEIASVFCYFSGFFEFLSNFFEIFWHKLGCPDSSSKDSKIQDVYSNNSYLFPQRVNDNNTMIVLTFIITW
jgi:hypothetical protein